MCIRDSAPPPKTTRFKPSTADVAQVDADVKYGMPPLVPAIMSAGVVVGVFTVTIPPVNPTEVTVPLPPPPDPAPALALAPLTPYPRMVPWPVPDDALMTTVSYTHLGNGDLSSRRVDRCLGELDPDFLGLPAQ